jgi:predicted Zn-dependent protease with MMP-like domain
MSPSFNSDSRWTHMRAPTAADLSLLARKVWDAVPASLRDLTGEIAIVVEEFPDEDTMDEVGAETPFDIMGLLRTTTDSPPALVIFRRAILDYWVETGDELSAVLDPCDGARDRPPARLVGRDGGPARSRDRSVRAAAAHRPVMPA